MKAIMGSILLSACVITTIMITISNSKVELAKEAMENYAELNFLAEPYMSSLSKMTYPTSCGNTEIYELMAYAADQGSPDFEFCGSNYNLNTIIEPYHTQFRNAFGAVNYYLFIEDGNGKTFFSEPQIGPEGVSNLEILSQMPIPLPGRKVSRVILAKEGSGTQNLNLTAGGAST
jgi:hypothetical protein